MRIALAQINPTIGDFPGNRERIVHFAAEARRQGAQLVMFPELALTGYSPRDLLLLPAFRRVAADTLVSLLPESAGIAILLGAPREDAGRLYNSAFLLTNGQLRSFQDKTLLPTYDVFDDARYFASSESHRCLELGGLRLGVTICEDMWAVPYGYDRDPMENLLPQKPDLWINLSASPFHLQKQEDRLETAGRYARLGGIPFLYVNQVGGNDAVLYDGRSFVLDREGRLLQEGAAFKEDLLLLDLPLSTAACPLPPGRDEALLHDALVMGTRDYFRKTGFRKAVLGLSGGIDSAVTAAIAARALGPEQLLTVGLPSPFSSPGSITDARDLATRLGCAFRVLPIDDILSAVTRLLPPQKPLTLENLQPRIRMLLLMALSSEENALVLSAANRSEIAMGFSTLYGDHIGALSILGDVLKSDVYRLAAYLNGQGPLIPEAILTKEPSAELAPNQKDSDRLPPYDLLDPLLTALLDDRLPLDDARERTGLPLDLVRSVATSLFAQEYKRSQGPLTLRIHPHTFGTGRRMPIAQRWKENPPSIGNSEPPQQQEELEWPRKQPL